MLSQFVVLFKNIDRLNIFVNYDLTFSIFFYPLRPLASDSNTRKHATVIHT